MKCEMCRIFQVQEVKLGWRELDSPLESARGERKRRDRNEHAAQGTRKMAPATALKDAIKNFEAAKGVKAAETEKVRPCLDLTVGARLPRAQPRTPRSVRRGPAR